MRIHPNNHNVCEGATGVALTNAIRSSTPMYTKTHSAEQFCVARIDIWLVVWHDATWHIRQITAPIRGTEMIDLHSLPENTPLPLVFNEHYTVHIGSLDDMESYLVLLQINVHNTRNGFVHVKQLLEHPVRILDSVSNIVQVNTWFAVYDELSENTVRYIRITDDTAEYMIEHDDVQHWQKEHFS